MIGAFVDSLLARISARRRARIIGESRSFRSIDTPVGTVRVYDSGSTKPCVVMVPDGPNVIEHYDVVINLLSQKLRVVCFDMPGFGYSSPQYFYEHSLDQGAHAVLGVLDSLGIERATLAFSCANGFYALRAAKLAPERIPSLVLRRLHRSSDARLDSSRYPEATAYSCRGANRCVALSPTSCR